MDVLEKTAEADSRGGSRGRMQGSTWRCPGTLLYARSCTGLLQDGFTSSTPWSGLWIWCCVNECLIWAGRCPLLLLSMVYGASVAHGTLSKLTGFCPREAYALEEVPIFELMWIILIWGYELSFSSFSSLKRFLFPQSHFCLPCYCCTSSLWTLPTAGEACKILWGCSWFPARHQGSCLLPSAQAGEGALLMLLCSVDLGLVKHTCLQKSWLWPGKQVAPC